MTPLRPVVIRLVERADGRPSPYAGQWLAGFEQPCAANAWRGVVQWTPEAGEALRFRGAVEAQTFWRQAFGRRSDGEPNRPLTAFTVAVEAAP